MLQYPLQLPPSSVPSSVSAPSRFTTNGPILSCASSGSCVIEDILAPGDIVGEGRSLQREPIRLVSIDSQPNSNDDLGSIKLAQECEVVRRLGSGSYAVVYLVKEVLSRSPPSEGDQMSTISAMEFDDDVSRSSAVVYGREYAIKCLPKQKSDEKALVAQLAEANIHQSLRPHPNIVTLHRTFQTSSFILLLMEYVPGEDLFYFLEAARDHYEGGTANPVPVPRTPATPSLLSSLRPPQLLSQARLRLIASMFGQMCEAVAACHAQQVYHRDIKPENFIVTDGWVTLPDGRPERKVIVKLTDFGLSTTDTQSADFDCGSAPYMSYECRNNVTPTYHTCAADVWSLGIVLINMIYHLNPWTDTFQGACASFDLFRRDPVNFFMHRFIGVTQPVADFWANRVFCILGDSGDDLSRATAGEFGLWVKSLPTLLGVGHDMHRTLPSGLASRPVAPPTPLFRSTSANTRSSHTQAVASRPQPHAPPGHINGKDELCELSTASSQTLEDQSQQSEGEWEELSEGVQAPSTPSMRSSARRRKRGARKRKRPSARSPAATDETLTSLAIACQKLARELDSASQAPPAKSVPTKKPSKWKLSFGKQNVELSVFARSKDSLSSSPSPPPGLGPSYSRPTSATVSNVTHLIMGLNDPAHSPTAGIANKSKSNSQIWTRGHGWRGSPTLSNSTNEFTGYGPPSISGAWNSGKERSPRGVSPHSIRSGRSLASGPSSITSGDERSCYYSCMSTTMSRASWRTGSEDARSPASFTTSSYPKLPTNIKVMTGVPWELGQLPSHTFSDSWTRKSDDHKLDTINGGAPGALKDLRSDVATSGIDLTGDAKEGDANVQRVQKGQISTLAKMLSALRR